MLTLYKNNIMFGKSFVRTDSDSFKNNRKVERLIKKLTDEDNGDFGDTFHSFRKSGFNFEVIDTEDFYNIRIYDKTGQPGHTRVLKPCSTNKIVSGMIYETFEIMKRKIQAAADILRIK